MTLEHRCGRTQAARLNSGGGGLNSGQSGLNQPPTPLLMNGTEPVIHDDQQRQKQSEEHSGTTIHLTRIDCSKNQGNDNRVAYREHYELDSQRRPVISAPGHHSRKNCVECDDHGGPKENLPARDSQLEHLGEDDRHERYENDLLEDRPAKRWLLQVLNGAKAWLGLGGHIDLRYPRIYIEASGPVLCWALLTLMWVGWWERVFVRGVVGG